jgi:hypothetical protein
MGVFDFLKRGGNKAGGGARERNKPRDQHYAFAHVVLRQLAFEDPVGCIGVLHSPEKDKMLASLWDKIGEQCRAGGAADGVVEGPPPSVRPAPVGRFPSSIVTMPEALDPTEAHFIAIVLHVDVAALRAGDEPPERPELSYFTLEKGVSLTGQSRTVLCGWNAEGSHLNFGDGPPAEFDAFVAAVAEHVTGGGAAPVAGFNPGNGPDEEDAGR